MLARRFFNFSNREFIASILALSLSIYAINLKLDIASVEAEKVANIDYYETQLNNLKDYYSEQLMNTRRSSEVNGCYEGIRQNCLMYSKKADICFQKLAEICPNISQ